MLSEKFRKNGIESAMFAQAWGASIDRGYRYGEFSWILEDNTIVHDTATGIFSAEHYNTYRIYERLLGERLLGERPSGENPFGDKPLEEKPQNEVPLEKQ